MSVTRIAEHLELGVLEGHRPRGPRFLKLAVKSTTRSTDASTLILHRVASALLAPALIAMLEAQRGPVVSGGGVAGVRVSSSRGSSRNLDTHHLIQAVQRQLIVESEEEGFVDLVAEFSVRGDVDNGELFILQLLF